MYAENALGLITECREAISQCSEWASPYGPTNPEMIVASCRLAARIRKRRAEEIQDTEVPISRWLPGTVHPVTNDLLTHRSRDMVPALCK